MKRFLLLTLSIAFATTVFAEMPDSTLPLTRSDAAPTAAIPTTTADSLCNSERSQLHKQRFLPTKRRMDREINKMKFAYKGEVAMGLTASYGTLSSEDADVLTILSSLAAEGTIASIKPSFGFFYRDNHCLGVRIGYTYIKGSIDGEYDLGESNDFSGSLPYFDISSNSYSFGLFHRSFAGIDPKGRFGLFAEFELSVTSGSANDAHRRNGELVRIYSNSTRVKLSFNPGVAVYIVPSVCATVSFGLGGIQYAKVTQKDSEGNTIGTREASKMRFRLNLIDINFGMNFHLWNKKK